MQACHRHPTKACRHALDRRRGERHYGSQDLQAQWSLRPLLGSSTCGLTFITKLSCAPLRSLLRCWVHSISIAPVAVTPRAEVVFSGGSKETLLSVFPQFAAKMRRVFETEILIEPAVNPLMSGAAAVEVLPMVARAGGETAVFQRPALRFEPTLGRLAQCLEGGGELPTIFHFAEVALKARIFPGGRDRASPIGDGGKPQAGRNFALRRSSRRVRSIS